MAQLVAPHLEREDAPVDPGAQQIVLRQLLLRHKHLDVGGDLDVRHQHVGEVERPALAGVGCAGNICREIDEIRRRFVADIEVGALPLVSSLSTGDAEEWDAPPRNDGGGAARDHGLVRSFETLDGLGSESEVMAPMVELGP